MLGKTGIMETKVGYVCRWCVLRKIRISREGSAKNKREES
jgi:hypothetical protein